MKISCNRLKKYIKNADTIDWLKIWDLFTIRTAEVEEVVERGLDMKDVVVAQITECETHPTIEKYHLLKVTDGTNNYNILCGAPNVRVGLKAPLVKIGGMVSGITIESKKIAGFISEGMLCSGTELGINYYSEGIIELPDDAPLGVDLHDYMPINDIIVEIDNKSLTNRPDLWGHYGIAREIAAITSHELLPLQIEEVKNDKKDLNIKVLNPELCKRYTAIELANINNLETSYEDQIFITYVGMRPINLIVDATNMVMLELGQPMHAFDSRVVKNIEVGLASNGDEYTTLDGKVRKLNEDILMIKNDNKYFGIAGIMGGLDSEILSDTTSLTLESATFDATCIRKAATFLGLRTEASARYEKSLDPEITDVAIKRFIAILRDKNKDMEIASNLTDIKNYKLENTVIELDKKLLGIYLDEDIEESTIMNILESLEFVVKNEKDKYVVTVPSFRATKDIQLPVDLIEEIARMYGYENIEPKPLKIDITFKEHEFDYTNIYNIKKFLASRYSLNEIHSYLWYDTNFLKQNCIKKDNITIVNKNDNNILRDDMSLSLLPIVKENFKNLESLKIFEIGTVIVDGKNKTELSIILADDHSNLENNYNLAKKIIQELFKNQKNSEICFKDYECESYNRSEFAKEIILNDESYGTLNVSKTTLGKKKSAVCVNIDIDKFLLLEKRDNIMKTISKYPTVSLDYTIVVDNNTKYDDIKEIIDGFENIFIIDYKLKDLYKDKDKSKYTIRYNIGSKDKTLEQFELNAFKERFISYIKSNNLEIIE